jgi:hypothetical protein
MGWQNRTDNNKFFVSTQDTFDRGWETMVFPIIDGQVDYGELYTDRYSNDIQADEGHRKVLAEWSSK